MEAFDNGREHLCGEGCGDVYINLLPFKYRQSGEPLEGEEGE